MRMVPCDYNEVGGLRKKTDNYKILTEFIESGLDCVKIEDYTQQNAYSCAGSLGKSIVTYRFGAISAVVRQGEVYLIKNTIN